MMPGNRSTAKLAQTMQLCGRSLADNSQTWSPNRCQSTPTSRMAQWNGYGPRQNQLGTANGKVQDAAGNSFSACRPSLSTISPNTASPLSLLLWSPSLVKAVRLPSSLGITPVARTTSTARSTGGIDTQRKGIESQHPLPDWCLHDGGKAATTAGDVECLPTRVESQQHGPEPCPACYFIQSWISSRTMSMHRTFVVRHM